MAPVDAEKYRAVIQGKRWRDLRTRLLRQRGERCERCGKTWAPGYKHNLQLHHKTYEHLGAEPDTDVQLVCAYCHDHADEERAAEAQVRSERALYDARLDGWARKKYGEDWDSRDVDDVAREFDDWLERE